MFRDKTGRPGPSTWELSNYAEGQADYPVTGVSWYEAAAYAEFVGKSLPTVYHWDEAAGTWAASDIAPISNFGKGLAAVGSYRGLGPHGTYDMAGNAKEWCWNISGKGNKRYVLGGAWNEPAYMFTDADAQSPFSRLLNTGSGSRGTPPHLQSQRLLLCREIFATSAVKSQLPMRSFALIKPVRLR